MAAVARASLLTVVLAVVTALGVGSPAKVSAATAPSCAGPPALQFLGLPPTITIGRFEMFGWGPTGASDFDPTPPFRVREIGRDGRTFYEDTVDEVGTDLEQVRLDFGDRAARIRLDYFETKRGTTFSCARTISQRVAARTRLYVSCANRNGTAYLRRYRPRNCAYFGRNGSFGGGVFLRSIRWSHWNRRVASGRGIECGFHLPCENIPARIKAYRPRTACGRVVYTRLRVSTRFGTVRLRPSRCGDRSRLAAAATT